MPVSCACRDLGRKSAGLAAPASPSKVPARVASGLLCRERTTGRPWLDTTAQSIDMFVPSDRVDGRVQASSDVTDKVRNIIAEQLARDVDTVCTAARY